MIESSAPTSIARVIEQFVREELSQENAQIAGAVWAMLDAGGKQLRPRITMLSGLACDPADGADPVLASYMELIHVATLVHDDVVDAADLRRGKASVNRAHGNRFSVLAGDYLFSWVFKKVTQTYAAPVPTVLAAMLSEICNGEVKQLRAAGNIALRVDEYFEIIGKKTAELFAACAEVGAIVALQGKRQAAGPAMRELPAVKALRRYGYSFGMAFQIRDDLLDLIARDETIGKPAGSDLREKKVTLPLLYGLAQDDGAVRALAEELFAFQDAASASAEPTLRALVGALTEDAIVARTRAAVARFAESGSAAIDGLPPSNAREELSALAGSLSQLSA